MTFPHVMLFNGAQIEAGQHFLSMTPQHPSTQFLRTRLFSAIFALITGVVLYLLHLAPRELGYEGLLLLVAMIGAVVLAKDVAKKIEAEMTYPGQIKVHVIRETRAVEYAR